MGIEIERFSSVVDENFFCPICSNVLENPVRISGCEHMFCRVCINTWINRNSSCPVDRRRTLARDLIPPNRTVISIFNRLQIKCEFESQGCRHVTSLESIENHKKDCDFNPNKKRLCRAGCGQLMKKAEAVTHRCVKMMEMEIAELKKGIDNQNNLVCEYQITVQELIKKNDDLESIVNQYQTTIQELIEKNCMLTKIQKKTIDSLKIEFEVHRKLFEKIKIDVEKQKRKAQLEIGKNEALMETLAKNEFKLENEKMSKLMSTERVPAIKILLNIHCITSVTMLFAFIYIKHSPVEARMSLDWSRWFSFLSLNQVGRWFDDLKNAVDHLILK